MMSAALIVALVFTVALLVTTAYFIMGSIPLLVLKHDTPLDAGFVRSFFNLYYVAAVILSAGTSVSYGVAGRAAPAVGAALLALVPLVLRRQIIPKMALLGTQIQASGADAIRGFRRIHVVAVLCNVVQLVAIVWSLASLSPPPGTAG